VLGLNRETAHNVFVFQSLTPGHAVMQLGQAHNPEVCVCVCVGERALFNTSSL